MKNLFSKASLLTVLMPFCFMIYLFSCSDTRSSIPDLEEYKELTGIPLREAQNFRGRPSNGQIVGPDMVFIEGGSTIMGVFADNSADAPKKEVTVTSFYLKETEVTNKEWNKYLAELKKNHSEEVYKAALPDEKVWVTELGYNDPYESNYRKNQGFAFYPVVGVSWTQAVNYCNWLTEFTNQYIADKKASKEKNKDEDDENDEGDDEEKETETDQSVEGETDAEQSKSTKKAVKANKSNEIEENTFIAGYRLPTEAEWEYAARAMVGTQSLDFVQASNRIYPWGDGLSLRGKEGAWEGKYLGNFKRSKGNYKGVPGESKSSAPTTKVYDYPPNDLGLYDMGGNVSEWVNDTYRPFSYQDFDDFNPIRRDETLDPEKDYDPNNSLVNNRSKVYKGASWKDCSHWAIIGTRRYLDQDSSRATIGFRYALTSMGDDEN